MPEKDGSLGLGGLSSALGNGTPAYRRSSSTAMITTGSGRITDNPASMSTAGDGSRAIQGGTRGSRGGTTATANAAMRANRRNGSLTNSGALRAANGFATVAAKLETAINRQSAMLEKQTNQIIIRLDMLNKTAATMSEMFQKANSAAIKLYDEQTKKIGINWVSALMPSVYKTNAELFKRFFTDKVTMSQIGEAFLEKFNDEKFLGGFLRRFFNYNSRVFKEDKKVAPWTRENSVALTTTIPNAIAQLDKNIKAISTLTVIKFDKANTILEEQLAEEYRHNARNEELLTDIATKFTAYFKTSSGQREAIGLSANHIQNTADNFYLKTDAHRGRLIKELNGMTNHVVDQFVEIMDNVNDQLSGAASYMIEEMELMLDTMTEKLILGPKFAKEYNRSQFASPAMDRSRIKTYTSAAAPKIPFTATKPDSRLTNWITSFYRTDAARTRDLDALMKKLSNQMNVKKDTSAADFSKEFAKAFNINNANAQPIQNMLALMAPRGKSGNNLMAEDIAANLLATMGFGSDISKNPEFQKRLLEKFGIKYNANRPTHVSALSRAIQNKVNKNDITMEDLLKVIGGNAKNANELLGNIVGAVGIKEQGYESKHRISNSILNISKGGKKQNNQEKALEKKTREALIRLGGLDKSKAKGASIEELQKQVLNSVKAVETSSSVTRNQIKTSTLLITTLQGVVQALLTPRNLFGLAKTALKFFTLFRGASALFGGMRWVKNNPIFKTIGGYINDWIWKPAKKYLIEPLVSGVKSLMVKYIPPAIMDKISKVTDSVVGFVNKWGGVASTAMFSDDPQERRNARSQIVTGIGSVFTGVFTKYVLPALWKIARWLSIALMGWKMAKAGASMALGAVKSKAKTIATTAFGAVKSNSRIAAENFMTKRIGFSPFWDSVTGYYLGMNKGTDVLKEAAKSTGRVLGSAAKLTWKGSKAAYNKIASTQTGKAVGSVAKTAWNNATAGVVAGFNDLKAAYTKWAQNGGAKKLIKSIELDALHLFNRARHKLFDPKGLIGSKIPAAKKIFSSMQTSVLNVFNNVKKKMFDIKGMIMPKLLSAKSIFESIANGALNIFNDIKKKMFDPKGAVGSKVMAGLNKVKGFWSNWVHEQQKMYFMSPEIRKLGEGVDKIKNNKYVKGAFNYVTGSKVGKAVSGAATKAMGYVKSTKIGGAVVSALAGKSMAGAATTVLGSLVGIIGKAAALVTPVGIGLAIVAAGGWLIKKIIDCVFKPAAEKEGVSTKDAHGVGTAVYNFVSDSVSKFFNSASHFLDEYGGFVGLVKMFFSGMGGLIRGIWGGIAKAVGSDSGNPVSVIGRLTWNIVTGFGNILWDIIKMVGEGLYNLGKSIIMNLTPVGWVKKGWDWIRGKDAVNKDESEDWYENSVRDLFENDKELKAKLKERAGGDKSKMKDIALMESILGSSKVSRMKEVSQSKENRDIASNYRFFEEREKKLAEREAKEKAESGEQTEIAEEEHKDQDSFRDKVSGALDNIKDYFNAGKFVKDIGTMANKVGTLLKDTLSSIRNFDYKGAGNSIAESFGGFAGNFLSGIMGEAEAFDLFKKIGKYGEEKGSTALSAFASKAQHTIASDITDIARFTAGSQDKLEEIRQVLQGGVDKGWGTAEQMQQAMENYENGKSAREGKQSEKTETPKTETTKTATASTSTAGSTTKTSTPSSTNGSVAGATNNREAYQKALQTIKNDTSKNKANTFSGSSSETSGGFWNSVKSAFSPSSANGGNVASVNINPGGASSIAIKPGNTASGTVYAAGMVIPNSDKSRVRMSGTYGEGRRTHTHAGIDISHYPATGKIPQIIAPLGGVVTYVGKYSGYGRTVVIRHDVNGQTYTTLYGHLESFADGLKPGATIAAGDLIGYMGTSGTSGGRLVDRAYPRHLHFGVAKGKQTPLKFSDTIDPVAFLNMAYTVRNSAGTTTVPAGGDLVGYETADYTANKVQEPGLAPIGEKSGELGRSAIGANFGMTQQILKSSEKPVAETQYSKNIDEILSSSFFSDMSEEQKAAARRTIMSDSTLSGLVDDYESRWWRGPLNGWYQVNQAARIRKALDASKEEDVKEEAATLSPEALHLRAMLREGGASESELAELETFAKGYDKFNERAKKSLTKYNDSSYGAGEFGTESASFLNEIRAEQKMQKNIAKYMPKLLGTHEFDNVSEADKARIMELASSNEEARDLITKFGSNVAYTRWNASKDLKEILFKDDIIRAKKEAERSNNPEQYTDNVIKHVLRMSGVNEADLPGAVEAAKHDKSLMSRIDELKDRIERGDKFEKGELFQFGSSFRGDVEIAKAKQTNRANRENEILSSEMFRRLSPEAMAELKKSIDSDKSMSGEIDRYTNEFFRRKKDTTKAITDTLLKQDISSWIEEGSHDFSGEMSEEMGKYLREVYKASGLSEEEANEKLGDILTNRELLNEATKQFNAHNKGEGGTFKSVAASLNQMQQKQTGEREKFDKNIASLLSSSAFDGYDDKDKKAISEMMWLDDKLRKDVLNYSSWFGPSAKSIMESLKSTRIEKRAQSKADATKKAAEEAEKKAKEEKANKNAKPGSKGSTTTSATALDDVRFDSVITELLAGKIDSSELPRAKKLLRSDKMAMGIITDYIRESDAAAENGGVLDEKTKTKYSNRISSIVNTLMRAEVYTQKTKEEIDKKNDKKTIEDKLKEYASKKFSQGPSTDTHLDSTTITENQRLFNSGLCNILGLNSYKLLDAEMKKNLYDSSGVRNLVYGFSAGLLNPTKEDIIAAAESDGIHMLSVFKDSETEEMLDATRKSEEIQSGVRAEAQLASIRNTEKSVDEYGNNINEAILKGNDIAKVAATADVAGANANIQAAKNIFIMLNGNSSNNMISANSSTGGGGGGGLGGSRGRRALGG